MGSNQVVSNAKLVLRPSRRHDLEAVKQLVHARFGGEGTICDILLLRAATAVATQDVLPREHKLRLGHVGRPQDPGACRHAPTGSRVHSQQQQLWFVCTDRARAIDAARSEWSAKHTPGRRSNSTPLAGLSDSCTCVCASRSFGVATSARARRGEHGHGHGHGRGRGRWERGAPPSRRCTAPSMQNLTFDESHVSFSSALHTPQQRRVARLTIRSYTSPWFLCVRVAHL